MRKLLIIPGAYHSLGGTVVTLSTLVAAFKACNASEQLCVLVPSNSFVEKYLTNLRQSFCLKVIPSENHNQFLRRSLQWVSKQPSDWPLLLDNCVWRSYLPILAFASPGLRLSRRPVYHFCHDLAQSYNYFGFLTRKFSFSCLAPRVLCNSHFTAEHVRHIMPDIRAILYQPVDTNKFNDKSTSNPPPKELQSILQTRTRIMLTPSRINDPGIVNDKNLQALISVLASLKASGHHYHGIVIGEDNSPSRKNSNALLESAKSNGVADCFTILPPSFAIENYYKYADVVVTLAPREPFGRVVVEAIACGVPVVGSCTGGVGEILKNFAPEWMVDPNDPVAAANVIVRIATDANTPNVVTQGKDWVKTHCNPLVYAQRMMNITGLIP